MIIAIDGPAGTGKSTIAKMLAEKLEQYKQSLSKEEILCELTI